MPPRLRKANSARCKSDETPIPNPQVPKQNGRTFIQFGALPVEIYLELGFWDFGLGSVLVATWPSRLYRTALRKTMALVQRTHLDELEQLLPCLRVEE